MKAKTVAAFGKALEFIFNRTISSQSRQGAQLTRPLLVSGRGNEVRVAVYLIAAG
jgi:hypothetical protein